MFEETICFLVHVSNYHYYLRSRFVWAKRSQRKVIGYAIFYEHFRPEWHSMTSGQIAKLPVMKHVLHCTILVFLNDFFVKPISFEFQTKNYIYKKIVKNFTVKFTNNILET